MRPPLHHREASETSLRPPLKRGGRAVSISLMADEVHVGHRSERASGSRPGGAPRRGARARPPGEALGNRRPTPSSTRSAWRAATSITRAPGRGDLERHLGIVAEPVEAALAWAGRPGEPRDSRAAGPSAPGKSSSAERDGLAAEVALQHREGALERRGPGAARVRGERGRESPRPDPERGAAPRPAAWTLAIARRGRKPDGA
jgi:hypothetical protein